MENMIGMEKNRRVLSGDITRHVLDNGLVVLVLPGNTVPVVAVDVWYKVGSKDEQPGKSGFAHLFEHMMFEGSENVGKGEHMKLISEVGGWMNASTGKDRTNYFEVVPSNQLALALWLEADRMRSLKVTRENFENQRDTVKEERRMRVDNAPYAPVFYEILDELAFQNWAYRHSLIGSMADLDNARLEDVIAFHQRYYRPNNAILAVAGDCRVDDVLALVNRYFAAIPAGEAPPEVDLSEPAQKSEIRRRWEDPFAPLPALVMAFKIPPRTSAAYYPLSLLERWLGEGESARLHRRLVEQEQVAAQVSCWLDPRLGPGLFTLFVQLAPGRQLEDLERILNEELERAVQTSPSATEMERIHNQSLAEYYSKLERCFQKADLLCLYQMYSGRPEDLFEEIGRLEGLGAEDVQAAAQQFLIPANRTVIEIVPAGGR
ncbi:MAG: insulinase family protein [Calditrichaeota bacterium]|nr:MAG: insulinase family protein [Calditrichota bacterium]